MVSPASETVVLHVPWQGQKPQPLLLRRLEGSEGLGTCFEYALTFDTPDCDITPEAVLGQRCSVEISLGARGQRWLDGYVSELGHLGYAGKHARYRLVLRPGLWLLSRNRDCRVFERQSVPEILAELLAFHGQSDVDFRLSEGYRPRAQCVQYLESDLTFAQRLMHEEGMYYFFEHEPRRHVLVIADSARAHAAARGCESLPFRAAERPARGAAGPVVHRWTSRQKLLAAGVALPGAELERAPLELTHSRVDATQRVRHPVEIFDYPGAPGDYEEGARQSRLRLDELLASYEACEGATDAPGLYAGARFALSGVPRKADNREYLLISQSFVLDCEPASTELRYYASLRACDAGRAYRMQQIRKPNRIQGVQLARVVDAELPPRPDAVRVRFVWDRGARLARAGSCWATVFRGDNEADDAWPQAGDDVLVEFLDGDPDRPVIIGRPRRSPVGVTVTERGKPRVLRTVS